MQDWMDQDQGIEQVPVAAPIELSEIAAAISSCLGASKSTGDLAAVRLMIRFFNDQALATGYSGLN